MNSSDGGHHHGDEDGNFDQILSDQAGTGDINGGITVDDYFNGEAQVFAINGEHAHFFTTSTPAQAPAIRNSHTLLAQGQGNSTVPDLGATTNRNENPIGLKLTKRPSFANRINQLLTSYGKKKQRQELGAPQPLHDVVSKHNLRASNFPALSLHIGSWEKISRHEGELAVKCYMKKRTLVWEGLEGNKKIKIEFSWSNISAIRAHFRPNKPGTLDVMLHNKPSFSLERDPQPRKHTIWNTCPDFTTNKQASLVRRHRLKFAPGVLEKHYEGIIRADPHLLALNNKPFPYHANPFFEDVNERCLDNTLPIPLRATPCQPLVPIRALPTHGTTSAMLVMGFPGHNQLSTEPSHFGATGNNTIHNDTPHKENAALQLQPNTLLHDSQSQSEAATEPSAANNQPLCHQGSDAGGSDPMSYAVQSPTRSYLLHQDHTVNVHRMMRSTMIIPPPSTLPLPCSNQSSFQDSLDQWSQDCDNYQWIQDYHVVEEEISGHKLD